MREVAIQMRVSSREEGSERSRERNSERTEPSFPGLTAGVGSTFVNHQCWKEKQKTKQENPWPRRTDQVSALLFVLGMV